MPLVIENDIESYLVSQVIAAGGKCVKFISPAEDGVPDRMVIVYGLIAFAELKRPKGGRLSEIQKYQIKKLRDLGVLVYVPKNKEEVNQMLEELKMFGRKKNTTEIEHRHWATWDRYGEVTIECSGCGGVGQKDYKYCPHCGARMDRDFEKECVLDD